MFKPYVLRHRDTKYIVPRFALYGKHFSVSFAHNNAFASSYFAQNDTFDSSVLAQNDGYPTHTSALVWMDIRIIPGQSGQSDTHDMQILRQACVQQEKG